MLFLKWKAIFGIGKRDCHCWTFSKMILYFKKLYFNKWNSAGYWILLLKHPNFFFILQLKIPSSCHSSIIFILIKLQYLKIKIKLSSIVIFIIYLAQFHIALMLTWNRSCTDFNGSILHSSKQLAVLLAVLIFKWILRDFFGLDSHVVGFELGQTNRVCVF